MFYTKYVTIESESALRAGDEGEARHKHWLQYSRSSSPCFSLSRLSVQWNSVKCWTVANVNNRCMFRSDPLWTLAVFVDLTDDDHSQSRTVTLSFQTSFCNIFPRISRLQIYVNIWTACRNCSQMSFYEYNIWLACACLSFIECATN